MGKENRKEPMDNETTPEKTIEEQGRDQTGQKRVRVRIDDSNVKTSYASGFRQFTTAEEVVIDFGLNLAHLTGDKTTPYEVVFQANNRIIMSYYSTKRLAITLGQIVRRFEDKFGELQLNAAKRSIGPSE
ncbi:MAG: DUF3467 domain-containing protein [Planctomycetota bacterium]|jgi:hypothetical protein